MSATKRFLAGTFIAAALAAGTATPALADNHAPVAPQGDRRAPVPVIPLAPQAAAHVPTAHKGDSATPVTPQSDNHAPTAPWN
ncbi:hypothetical protein [Streptomyces sp. SP18CS02]|uniref:hypothetical protein n=1 Tax=Streptomyces sp. SP18CS02 TaxID=3002531 RepID=UPI002E79F527|nr:hypothetical protein [Streptomyces sp. SP18CS02]MEE1755770.1 hypothetical protein [Streptomyces sp. SP18CS02]